MAEPFDITSDIKALLTAITTDVYGELVADKDICLAVVHTGGNKPEHCFGADTKAAIIHPSFQIMARHPSEHLLHVMWDAIRVALDGKTNYTPTGTSRTYLFIEQQGDVFDLGRDQNRRHLQSLNFSTSIINAY
jgi:hypothetical protein